jgi:hypothetical protein
MAPLPAVQSKKSSNTEENQKPDVKRSPTKKSKVDMNEEELDYEHDEEPGGSDEFEMRARKKAPVSERLGDIQAMGRADTANYQRRQERQERFSRPDSVSSSPDRPGVGVIRETDPQTIARRRKQINYGKNTTEYIAYIEAVPK